MAPSAPPGQEEPTWLPSPGKQFSNQLAAVVRGINWTYAIFWSISANRPGFLTWKDGFYNGEIKTRKITNSTELSADQLVLERSEQLRELYESLLSGECDHRARRPAASLSPEDLGDAEWYYTLCMTYAFRPGQGLPGKCYVSNEHVWLCNAHFADTKTFQRALLAKTASIQTIACIPMMGGVLELGTPDEVLEDTDMVNRIGTCFWEIEFPARSEWEAPSSSPSPSAENEAGKDDVIVLEDLNHNATAAGEMEIECLSDGNLERITEEMYELYGGAVEENWIVDGSLEVMSSSPEAAADDVVVTRRNSTESCRGSCFRAWKRWSEDDVAASVVAGESQRLLKKAVAGGARRGQESNNNIVKGQHVMSERRRREKLNEMFQTLKSLVPSIHKVDKASILAETIAYLKELEQRVEALKTRPGTTCRQQRRRHDVVVSGNRKVLAAGSKRKASELGAGLSPKEDAGSNVVNVTVMEEEELLILEVQCRWKELVMTRVFDALKALSLDLLSVQSSTPADGLLALNIRAQYAGSAVVEPGTISVVLQRAIGKR